MGEGREGGGDHDAGDVFCLDRGRVDGDAHAIEHVGETLGGKNRLAFIAGAVQSDDETVADQLVVSNALEGREVFYSADGAGDSVGAQGGEDQEMEDSVLHGRLSFRKAEGP